MTTAEILERAADLLEHPGSWTRKAFVRDVVGHALTDPKDPRACAWCAAGAMARVASHQDVWWSAAKIFRDFHGVRASDWNDEPGRTQAQVVQALRDAAGATTSPARPVSE